MKQIYRLLLAVLPFCVQPVCAQEIQSGNARVENPAMGRISGRMFVSMDIAPSGAWNLRSSRTLTLTPFLERGDNRCQLPPIEIMGRNQYIHHLRDNGRNPGNNAYKASKAGRIHYETSVPFEEWMDGASLVLKEDLCGCSRTLLSSDDHELQRFQPDKKSPRTFTPVFAYVVPDAEPVKARSESGQAYVLFPLSRTDIDADYLNNRDELQKILSTVSLVRENKDMAITGITLRGYASPEGKYEENERLAKGRTQAVAGYVRQHSAGSDFNISTSYVAENWEGLRAYIARSGLRERNELLAIIDSPKYADNLDAREWVLKSRYPGAYRTLLGDCYPSLRRTDYTVTYTVRAFDTGEAKRLMDTRPQMLSLQEMYNVAQTYEPGSDAFNDVFDTAVRMFPNDPVANLNAANSALQRNDTILAERYLQKAGTSGEAVLARGILAMLKGDTADAEALMRTAQAMGVTAAAANLEQVLGAKK